MYIRNRCPTSSLNGITPYKNWTGKIPNVSYFREFGTDAYTLDRKPAKGKFEPRSRKCILIGYSEQSKGYRVWLPDERKVEITRDVRFLETNGKDANNMCEDFISENILNEQKNIATEPENLVAVIEMKPIIHIEDQPHQELEEPEANLQGPSSEGENELEVGSDIEGPAQRRGPGRPQKMMTGLRGRPRKKYHMVDAMTAEAECVYTAEIPVEQAILGPDAKDWHQAIVTELKSIIKHETWELVDRPENQKVIGSRVILTNKYKADGTIERRKARIVAKGFTQRPGIDFRETFAPVARLSSIRLMMAIAVQRQMIIHQFDATTAYLNGTLDEEIFMEPPELLEEGLEFLVRTERGDKEFTTKLKKMLEDFRTGDKICLLKKALYGLRQAGRQWHTRLNQELKKLGATPTNADPCMYSMTGREDLVFIEIYVDDILMASRKENEIMKLKGNLMKSFQIKDLGKVNYCLGIEFSQKNDEISMRQTGYIKDLLDRFKMTDSNPVGTPLDVNSKLAKQGDPLDDEGKNVPYRELVGALMYLAIATRPDIAHAVSVLSQFNSCFQKNHWSAAKRVLRYLKGTMDLGIVFKANSEPLKGFVDADWANCPDDRRSYTGYAFILSGGAISWESKKQRTVALSSTEAEYMGLAEAAEEGIYLQRFLTELGFDVLSTRVEILNDNLGAIRLAENPVFHARTKHIDIRHHFIREILESGLLRVEHTSTEDMAADVLTKGLPGPKHKKCLLLLGLTPMQI